MFAKKLAFTCLLIVLVLLVSGIGLHTTPTSQAAQLQEKDGLDQLNALLSPPLSDFIHIWTGDGVDNRMPAVAYNSNHDEYLVVWENDRGATRDIYARRVAGDGTIKSWFTIVSDANKWNWQPDVVYNPVEDEYLIVYTYQVSTSDYDIWARRVKWDGSWMSAEYAINQDSSKQWEPAVAYNSQNNEYLVVYENYWSGTMRDIAAQRVAADGTLLSWRNIASAANKIRRLPDVAYNAARNEYLIAYTFQHPTDGDILGKISSANMGTLGSEINIVDNTNDQDGVALTAAAGEYFAVWNDGTPTHGTIYGRRINGTGALQPFIPIADHSGKNDVEPDVAFGPAYGYLVVWRHMPSLTEWDVYGRFVKVGQNSAAGGEFVIDDEGGTDQKSPATACAGTGQCLVVEEDNSSMGGPVDYEIRGRFIESYSIFLPVVLK